MREHAELQGVEPPAKRKLRAKKLSVKAFQIEAAADEFMALCAKAGKLKLEKKKLLPPNEKW